MIDLQCTQLRMMDEPTGVIITCTGRADDPDIQEKISALLRNVSHATGVDETACNLKSVEPWNSVKVSFDLPREAAVRLQELAHSADDGLINLGILSVQIANGESLDLNAIRDLLQQPPPTLPVPQAAPQPMPSKHAPQEHLTGPTVPMPYQQMNQHPHQRHPGPSQPLQAPSRIQTVNQARKQPPKQSPGGLPPQLPPQQPASRSTILSPQPPVSPATSFVGLHKPMMHSDGGMIHSGAGGMVHSGSVMKQVPYQMGHAPSSSIGNIPAGIPSLHLGHPSKPMNTLNTINPLNPSMNPSMNISTPSNSFSSVYSIAMSMGGNPNASIQAPMMQSLPNLPTPQTAPVGSFPWNLGANPHQFVPGGQAPVLPQWNQPMFSGGPNLPTNLPGSIPSIGPLPTPARMPAQSAAPPPSKPKKKKKRVRKPPKEKIPPIPLPPPLMPPQPKPSPSLEGAANSLKQKPMGMPLPAGLNPISPNETAIRHTQGGAPATHPQHPPGFPFTQVQVSQAGKSDVSMTSPLLVNLLQSDIAATQFPGQVGDQQQMKVSGVGPGPGPSQQVMLNPSSIPSHHPPGTTMHTGMLIDGSHFPRNQHPQVYPHLLPGQQLHQTQQLQQHMHSLPQLSLPNQPLRSDLVQRANESLQPQQPQLQRLPFPMPYPPGVSGAPSSLPPNFSRFPLPQGGNLPPDHLQFMMQQVSSHAGLMEQRMQLPHSQGSWPSGPLPTLTAMPSQVSSAMGAPQNAATTTSAAQNFPPHKEPPQGGDSQSLSFDEESAMAGMTEAERDTFAAAAKIAQDSSKPDGLDVDAFGAVISPSGDFQLPIEMGNTLPRRKKTASGMFAIENLAVSNKSSEKKSRKSPKTKHPPPKQLSRPTMEEPSLQQSMIFGDNFSDITPEQLHNLRIQMAASESLSNENIDLSSLQGSPALMSQRMTAPVPFHSKAQSQPNQAIQNPFLTMSSGTGPGTEPGTRPNLPLQFGEVPGRTGPNMSLQQEWSSINTVSSKADADDSMGKSRGAPADSHGKAVGQPKQQSVNPHEWPFSNISPPTQNLSTEGLQFMAKLAAAPGDAQYKLQQPQYLMPDGSKPIKEDKPHLKALLNEMSSSREGQGGAPSPRPTKRLSSEEKSERKRRKSSPRPAPPDLMAAMYQPQRRLDHPGGSIELPRVPTAEELSYSVQQARAHSLDLLKSGAGYPPMPKSAPSSPRAKNRTKSVENIPQYGLQQSDLYRAKHGTLSPVNPMPSSFKGSTGSTKSGKSKESKSRSKSPKASGSKSSKQDASGLQSHPSVTTSANVPFAGVHEFHPPPGLNIRGPTNPLPYQSRKTPPQALEATSPMSPRGVGHFVPKQYQQQQPQNTLPSSSPQGPEMQQKSPRVSRPSSPFAPSASALLSSFAQSAFSKAPEPPTTAPGASESPIHSPGFVTSPPLQKISTPTLPSNVSLGPQEESLPDELLAGQPKGRADGTSSFPIPPSISESKHRPRGTEQEQLPMERILSPSGFPSAQAGQKGHFQPQPNRFHSMNQPQPGLPPLWRPPTSNQSAASSDPRAPMPNVAMPFAGSYEAANASAMRRNLGTSAPRPVQSPSALGPIRSVSGQQYMSGEKIMQGRGNQGHHSFPGSSMRGVGSLHSRDSFRGHSEVFNLRQTGIGLDGKSSIGYEKMEQDSAILMSRQHPKDQTFKGHPRMAFSSGPSGTVQRRSSTGHVLPGHPSNQMVMSTHQDGSSVQPYAEAQVIQRSQGSAKFPESVSYSPGHTPAPFSVSSLVSRPSPTQGGHHFGHSVSTSLPSLELDLSASSNIPPGPIKPERAPPLGSSSASRTIGGDSSAIFGLVDHVLSGDALLKQDAPVTATQAPVTPHGAHVTGTTSLPSLSGPDARGTLPSPSGKERVSSSVSAMRSDSHQPTLEGSLSNTEEGASTKSVFKPPLSEGKAGSNVTSVSSNINPPVIDMGVGNVVSSQASVNPSNSSPKSNVGLRSPQPGLSGGEGPAAGPGEHERVDQMSPPIQGTRPGAGNPGDGGYSERVSGTMKFMALGEDPGAEGSVMGDQTLETMEPGQEDDYDDEDEEGLDDDGDGPASRKRSMRASGRDMYYGPIPTYKRRKPDQK